MKLKLRTQSTETLKRCFSLISNIRKFVILRFSPTQLLTILINDSSVLQEPQVWCKFPMESIFNEIEVLSLKDNVVLLEINIEMFLQTLRHFDRANSHDLSLRLQKNSSTSSSSRSASLALYFSETTENANTINHTFRVPVRILKGVDELREPELPVVDLMMKLPNEFSSTYKRLDKFQHSMAQERVRIIANGHEGHLKFVLEEQDNYKVTIAWNDKIDMFKPQSASDSNSFRATAYNGERDGENDDLEGKEITVRLKDWRLAARIVESCRTVMFLICHNHACALHCLLDDTEDVEMVYYISAVRTRDYDD